MVKGTSITNGRKRKTVAAAVLYFAGQLLIERLKKDNKIKKIRKVRCLTQKYISNEFGVSVRGLQITFQIIKKHYFQV
ncbi:MAG: hypothetical protein ACTSR3_10175 [Candidatus Helarchaeota archaeon]